MKKKMLVLICTLLLAFGMTMTAAAEGSPQGKKDTTQTEDKSDKAPATGEGRCADLCGSRSGSPDRNSCPFCRASEKG